MKRTIALLLVLVTLLSLVACGSPSTIDNNQTQHTHSFGEWAITKNATCTEAGEQERYCSCGEKQTQSIAAKGHSFGEWAVTKAATCAESGEQERVCSCGERQTQTIAATGHSKELDYNTIMATCTESGSITGSCKICGKVIETKVLPASHIYDPINWSDNENDWNWTVVKEATCTEEGEKKIACVECGNELTRTIPATGHSFDEWTISLTQTCTADGNKTRKCSLCGTVENEVIPATGHSWNEATCTEPKTCSVCYATEGEALGHDYSNGTCTRCGEKFHPSVIIPQGTITIEGKNATVEISSISYDFVKYTTTIECFVLSFKVKKISTREYGTVAYRVRIFDSDGMLIQVYNMSKFDMEVGDSWKEKLEMNITKLSDTESITVEFVY